MGNYGLKQMKHDYNLKRKRVKPEKTILDSDKYMFRDEPVTREYEQPEDPEKRIVVDYVRLPESDNGPWALGTGIIATLIFIAFSYLLYRSEGNPELYVTVTGVCGVLWSIAAVILGIKAIAEKDRNHTSGFVGIALGAFQIITWIITVILTSR